MILGNHEYGRDKRPVVFHVLTSLHFGGVERLMEVISDELSSGKMRHIFVAIGSGGATADYLKLNGAEVLCLNSGIKIPSLGSIIRLIFLFREYRPLVVHTHGAEANFHGLIAAALVRVPVRIGEEIGIPSHSNKAKKIYRQIYRSAHRVIGVSKVVSDWLLSSKEVAKHKIICLNNPVRLPELRSAQAPDAMHKLRVCYVGRLEPVKNPLVLIGAARRLIEMKVPVEMLIIGDGSQFKQMEQEITKFELSHQIKLLGFQSDPAPFVCLSSVYVQPSLSEGFSLSLLEAMGCGVPAIVTRVGGAPELIEHGVTGWLLDDSTEETLAKALHIAWLTGPERLFLMGQKARLAVEGRFEPSNYLAQLESLYESLAQENG